ncbi:MAG: 30S ribosomal protein S8 [Patescibacteria group bacterium]|nr:30S ribosomal protein S8 [Patescibacteria group bacterium]
MNYQVSDFVIRLKNACLAKKREITTPYTKIGKAIGDVLVKEKYLDSLRQEIVDGKKFLKAKIRYEKRRPVLSEVMIISKPSLRIYIQAKKETKRKNKNMGISVVSTNLGIMTEKEAKLKGVGGELLFTLW